MRKKWLGARYIQRASVILSLLLQLVLMLYILYDGSMASDIASYLSTAMGIVIAIFVAGTHKKGENKMLWLLCILVFPVFGGFMYLLFRFQNSTRKFRELDMAIEEKTRSLFLLPGDDLKKAEAEFPEQATALSYLDLCAGFPIFSGSRVTYLSPGEVKFEHIIEELQKAEKYIFMEYFIIDEGIMWNSILDILRKKASEGVEVRLIYDDMGCFTTLPKDYPAKLKRYGIKCTVFNPFRPFWVSEQNNRDHRKITVIDGKVAFTGGINLADEYINAYERHGHWKDASVMVCGKAAWSFTVMFLRMWTLCSQKAEDFSRYYPWSDEKCSETDDGYIQPYSDSPLDEENVGEHVYLQMINGAKRYLYINTPYLIIGSNLVSALTLAAKSGVDVRIVTPHRWDKWIVHMTTRSYYRELINAGVKIYEYSSGFIHSKTFVSDDVTATVGTINLDFRSLYLHFECGIRITGGSAVAAIKEDFLTTLEGCQQITGGDCKNNLFMTFLQKILRIFAPLM